MVRPMLIYRAIISGDPDLPVPWRIKARSQPVPITLGDGYHVRKGSELVAHCDEAKQRCQKELSHGIQQRCLPLHKRQSERLGGALDLAHPSGITVATSVTRFASGAMTLLTTFLKSGFDFHWSKHFQVARYLSVRCTLKRDGIANPLWPNMPVRKVPRTTAEHALTDWF